MEYSYHPEKRPVVPCDIHNWSQNIDRYNYKYDYYQGSSYSPIVIDYYFCIFNDDLPTLINILYHIYRRDKHVLIDYLLIEYKVTPMNMILAVYWHITLNAGPFGKASTEISSLVNTFHAFAVDITGKKVKVIE